MSHLLQEQNLAERTRGQASYRDQELLLRHLRQRVLQQAESEGRRKTTGTYLWFKQSHFFIWPAIFSSVLDSDSLNPDLSFQVNPDPDPGF